MQMLSSHRCLLVIVAVELSIILVACLALHLSCHAKSMLGLGSTAKDRKRADVVLGISAAFPIILSVVALGLSTRPDLQTWMAPVERSVCLFLVFSQCVYIWLLLPSAKPWQLWVVCVCGILSPLLSLLPPTLESLDYTYHSAWYIHLPAPLLGLIICVIQVLLLGRQIRLSYKIKSPVAEAGIFLMLVVFFFNRKREYENQSVWMVFTMSIFSFKFFPIMEVFRICRGISNESQPSLNADLTCWSSSSTASPYVMSNQRWSLTGDSDFDLKMKELWILNKASLFKQDV